MQEAVAGGIIEAALFLLIGYVAACAIVFVAKWLWIGLGPSEDKRMERMYRNRMNPFDLKSFMGMKR